MNYDTDAVCEEQDFSISTKQHHFLEKKQSFYNVNILQIKAKYVRNNVLQIFGSTKKKSDDMLTKIELIKYRLNVSCLNIIVQKLAIVDKIMANKAKKKLRD